MRYYRKPKDRRTRQRRWRDAVQELFDIQADCQVWRRTRNAADVSRPPIAGFGSVCRFPPERLPSPRATTNRCRVAVGQGG